MQCSGITARLGVAARARTLPWTVQHAPSRTLAFSSMSRLGLKESSGQTDEDFEKHKRDSLAKQRQGSGHWKPELASDSEEAVRADRMGSADPKVLQEMTKNVAEEKAKAGTSTSKNGM